MYGAAVSVEAGRVDFRDHRLFAVLSNASNLTLVIAVLPFGAFSLAAAWFFFRSTALRAWTASA